MRFGFKSSVISATLLSVLMADLASAQLDPRLRRGGGQHGGGGTVVPVGRDDRRGQGGDQRGQGGDRGSDFGGGHQGRGRDNGPVIVPQPTRPAPQPTRPTPPDVRGPGRDNGPAIPPQPNRPGQDDHRGPIGGGTVRPLPPGGPVGGPVRPGGRDEDQLRRRRDDIRRGRMNRQPDIDFRRRQGRDVRNDFHIRFEVGPRRDVRVIRDPARWGVRYNTWWTVSTRPVIYRPVRPIPWHRPMPSIGYWSYSELDIISDNLEYLSRDVYTTMSQVAPLTPNREYAFRLMNVLGQLVNAAENYNDAVADSYDWSDSLYDLFNLDAALTTAETTLDGYSQAYRVDNEIRSLRYYVNELLWNYRQNYYY